MTDIHARLSELDSRPAEAPRAQAEAEGGRRRRCARRGRPARVPGVVRAAGGCGCSTGWSRGATPTTSPAAGASRARSTWARRSARCRVVRRHETLRTHFPSRAGTRPVQVVRPGRVAAPGGRPLAPARPRRASELDRRAGDDAGRPFDLVAGPLFRARLVRLAADDHALLWAVHHAVSDGWAGRVRPRAGRALRRVRAGRALAARRAPGAVRRLRAWQRSRLRGAGLEAGWPAGAARWTAPPRCWISPPTPAPPRPRAPRRHARPSGCRAACARGWRSWRAPRGPRPSWLLAACQLLGALRRPG